MHRKLEAIKNYAKPEVAKKLHKKVIDLLR
jgi:hypothetical protein